MGIILLHNIVYVYRSNDLGRQGRGVDLVKECAQEDISLVLSTVIVIINKICKVYDTMVTSDNNVLS